MERLHPKPFLPSMHPCTSQSAETGREDPGPRGWMANAGHGGPWCPVVSGARTLSSACRTRGSGRTSCLHRMVRLDSLLVCERCPVAPALLSCSYTGFERWLVQTRTVLCFCRVTHASKKPPCYRYTIPQRAPGVSVKRMSLEIGTRKAWRNRNHALYMVQVFFSLCPCRAQAHRQGVGHAHLRLG